MGPVRLFMGVFAILGLLAGGCSERRPSPAGNGDPSPATSPVSTSSPAPSSSPEDSNRHDGAQDGFPAQVAGSFYPGDPVVLRKMVAGFLDKAKPPKQLAARDVVGILTPHAGYRYSGPVAGEAYRLVQGRPYRTVVVLALSHRRSASRVSVLDRSSYNTPLGSLPVSQGDARLLLQKYPEVFSSDEAPFMGEHSLEVQLPFIQVAFPRAKVIPIVVAVQEESVISRAGKALFMEFGSRGDVLFVISSDLSHHFPYEVAKKYDNENLGHLENWEIDEWKVSASRMREGMCGVKPVLTFIHLFDNYPPGKRQVTRIKYLNSGDTAGNRDSVVGYGALAFSLESGMRNEMKTETDFGPYDAATRRKLMDIARKTVAKAVAGERYEPETPPLPLLKEDGAAFVTLKKDGNLRGCIGHVMARVPLYRCVNEVAYAAAVRDTRFQPVTSEELGDLTYEISILTTPEPIAAEDVVVGRDGLVMSNGHRSGLLLPQVPVEWGWDREEYLQHTCRKAGLPTKCWKDPATELKAFRAIVFGEDDL